MKIDFISKKVTKKSVANGLVMFVVPDVLYKLEPKNCTPKIRGDWYRELLDIDNLLFFSENESNGIITGESLIILDIHKDEYDPALTELNFAENGKSGRYTTPIIDINRFNFGMLTNFKTVLDSINSYNKTGGELQN